jgi:protein TonB
MRIRDVDLNSEEWRDLVFENRNTEYGAYHLRKTSTLRHLFSLFTVISGLIIIFILSSIIRFNRTLQTQVNEYEIKPIELSDLIWLEDNIVKNKQIKAEEKPPEEIVKFTPPVITKDEFIVEDLNEIQKVIVLPDSIDTFSELVDDTFFLHSEISQQNREEKYDTAVINEKNRNAVFQDGRIALLRYIYQNIQYPPLALKQRIKGRVICSFIVNEDGSISDVTLVQGIYFSLDEEVLRVIRSMPLWNPALQDGKAIKIKYIMPVVFV